MKKKIYNFEEEKERENKKTNKKINVWFFSFLVSIVLLIVSVVFNVLSFLEVSNKFCDITITTVSNVNAKVESNELLLGENYVCNIDLTNTNKSYIGKSTDVKIIVKKANIILEKGNFNNISYYDFVYNNDAKYVEAETDVFVNGFESKNDKITFNFCPTQIGDSCLQIEIYVGGKLVETGIFTVVM